MGLIAGGGYAVIRTGEADIKQAIKLVKNIMYRFSYETTNRCQLTERKLAVSGTVRA